MSFTQKLSPEWEMASNSSLLSSGSLHALTCSVAVAAGLFPSGHALINFYDSALSCIFCFSHHDFSFSSPILFFSYYKCDMICRYKFLKFSFLSQQFPQWLWLTPRLTSIPCPRSLCLIYNLPYPPMAMLQIGSWYKVKHSPLLASNDKVCSATSLVCQSSFDPKRQKLSVYFK